MKQSHILVAVLATCIYTGGSVAAVSEEEAKQLGNGLTLFGAEKSANKDGSIPEYTGGLPVTTSPPGFVADSGRWVNPFQGEKPLFSINSQNMGGYADKLTEGTKALLKRFPSYRVDVYPTHRTASFPKYILDATVRNATTVRTGNGGLSVENFANGIPFPIPKNGNEVMWNHMTRWDGVAVSGHPQSYYMDANGVLVLTAETKVNYNFPNNVPGVTPEQFEKNGGWYFLTAYNFLNPPRSLGDSTLILDNLDPVAKPRKAYQYSGSTRRVRLAPDIAYDTPIATTGGISTYDEAFLFFGKMDRFDFKLVGKKEIYIPYSNYDALFITPGEKLFTPKHLNPDYLRWELHRVWVIEATLKPGLRHIYSKRTFYFDEDGTGAGACEDYDAGGKLYKTQYNLIAGLYDKQTTFSLSQMGYDLATGNYALLNRFGFPGGYLKISDQLSPRNAFTPDGLVARSKQ